MEKLIIGSHVSFNKKDQLLGSVKEAISYKATTFMFYTGAPQNTNRCLIDNNLTNEALKLMKENNIRKEDVIVHAPYIINLANKGEKQEFGIRFLKEEIKRCEQLKMDKLVLHPGSHVGLGESEGLKNIVSALNEVLNDNMNITICLETMAGKGSELGTTFEEIKYIIDHTNLKNKLGVCLDTCHIHDGGYDLNNFDEILKQFDNIIGLNYLKCIHINDSKNLINTHKDRHENVGFGKIGFDTLIKIIYHPLLKELPKILETPYISMTDSDKQKVYPPYKFEIAMIKEKKFNPNLIKDIRSYYK